MIEVEWYIIIFLAFDIIVEMIFLCLRRMAVSKILNILERRAISIIRWRVTKTKRTFRWKVLAFCTDV
jgi:hypothetical protein